ncbi:MAG: 16S rRNA (cytidine(1402)-2'-O)-methyltransferase [Candidatus Latescibacteria bacterium]|nr:16S rRNA (cytidine(1402)-2'-O)-methyltransferase [Candidatus Latescibacterota bacterium]
MSTLFVVATPIGNLEDMTFRAVRTLGEVEALACEDTRTTRAIFERYQIPSPKSIFSYHDHNEERAGQRILALLRGGASVALCSDGGYPGISDPGYRIVSASIEAGFRVEVLPGAGAVATALVASGLPTSSYTFKGFPPRKSGPIRRFLEMEREMPHTLVFFESPYRIGKFLASAREVLGNRRAAVCIEMTKKFEAAHRGFLQDLAEQFREARVRGEITVVIAGNSPKFAKPEEEETRGLVDEQEDEQEEDEQEE